MTITDLLSAMRPFVAEGAAAPGLFRTLGAGLLGKGPLGPAMLSLPQMKNFGKAFDTAGYALQSPIANDFAMMNGTPYVNPPSMTGPMEAYAAKLRSGAVPSGVVPTAGTPAPGIPLPQPRPLMPGQTANVPLPQANPLRTQAAAPDNSPYGFVNSPAYMGQGSTRPATLFDLAKLFK